VNNFAGLKFVLCVLQANKTKNSRQKKCDQLVALREGYKTLIFRGGRLHLKSWYYITDF
jgi:hypothetical protein